VGPDTSGIEDGGSETDGTDDIGTEDQDDRTLRFLGQERLQRIREGSVTLIGAGALGNEVAKNLALLGVGRFHLVDFDVVSPSNLNRCIMFQSSDIGRKKVDALSDGIHRVRPDTIVETFDGRAEDHDDPLEFLFSTDIVGILVDDELGRFLINSLALCVENGAYMVRGAMGRTFVVVDVLDVPRTACLVCGWTTEYRDEVHHRKVREDCQGFFDSSMEVFPAISTLTSLAGSLVAAEMMKVIIGRDHFQQTGRWTIPGLDDDDQGEMADIDLSKMDAVTLSKMDAVTLSKMDAVTHSKMDAVTHSKMDAVTHSKMDAVTLSKMDEDPEAIPAIGCSIRYDIARHSGGRYTLMKNPGCVEPLCRGR